jgi:hypothetical protein
LYQSITLAYIHTLEWLQVQEADKAQIRELQRQLRQEKQRADVRAAASTGALACAARLGTCDSIVCVQDGGGGAAACD